MEEVIYNNTDLISEKQIKYILFFTTKYSKNDLSKLTKLEASILIQKLKEDQLSSIYGKLTK